MEKANDMHGGSSGTGDMPLRLAGITPDNYGAARTLSVRPDQETLVGSVQKSLADAYVYPQSLFRLGVVDDTPVGYVLLFPFDGARGRTVNVVRLMVDQRYQGRGFGRRMLTAALDWIGTFEPTVDTVRISTLPRNDVALNLYESLGFQRAGMEEGEIALYLQLDPET